MKKKKYKYQRLEEFKIPSETHEAIRQLLKRCFSEYPEGRSYYQQVPTYRYLVYHKQLLIGHMTVEYRVINISGEVVPIFGIGDFCIDPDYQLQSIASNLLSKAEKQARKHAIDFMLLIADEHGFYEKNGFKLKDNTCRWLMITKQQTLGVGQRKIEKGIMVKAIGTKAWTSGLLDFMGPIF